MSLWLLIAALFVGVVVATASASNAEDESSHRPRIAFASIANSDYFARGAFVTLHSLALHSRLRDGSSAADCVLMVTQPGISLTWRNHFSALGVRVVNISAVIPSKAVRLTME